MVALLPLLLGIVGLVALLLSGGRRGEEAEASRTLTWVAIAVFSLAPPLGVLLWAGSGLRRFRAQRGRITARGLTVPALWFGSRVVPWSTFNAFSVVRAGGVTFGLFTPRGDEATWVVEASKEAEEALLQAVEGRSAGEARFVYQTSLLRGWAENIWMVGGLVLGVSLALVATEGGQHEECCLLFPVGPAYALASVGFLVSFLARQPTSATLRIADGEAFFSVPERRLLHRLRARPETILGRPEVDDPTGLQKRHFALPRGSLSWKVQLELIQQLLSFDRDEETAPPGDAPAGWDVAPPAWAPREQEGGSTKGESPPEERSAGEAEPGAGERSAGGAEPGEEKED
jgi:hypothetical protein